MKFNIILKYSILAIIGHMLTYTYLNAQTKTTPKETSKSSHTIINDVSQKPNSKTDKTDTTMRSSNENTEHNISDTSNIITQTIENKLLLNITMGIVKITNPKNTKTSGLASIAGLWKFKQQGPISLLYGLQYTALDIELITNNNYYTGLMHQYIIPLQLYYNFKQFLALSEVSLGYQNFKKNTSITNNSNITKYNGLIINVGGGVSKLVLPKIELGTKINLEFGKISNVKLSVFTNFIF